MDSRFEFKISTVDLKLAERYARARKVSLAAVIRRLLSAAVQHAPRR